jgi:hypothetical protein
MIGLKPLIPRSQNWDLHKILIAPALAEPNLHLNPNIQSIQ